MQFRLKMFELTPTFLTTDADAKASESSIDTAVVRPTDSLSARTKYSNGRVTAKHLSPHFSTTAKTMVNLMTDQAVASSASASTPSPSPSPANPSSTGKKARVSLSINSLMNQSTIYRRHEARLARTYALRDDPRPAFLRVMANLPLLSMIVPPYDPETMAGSALSANGPTSNAAAPILAPTHRLGDYAEDTFFDLSSSSTSSSISSSLLSTTASTASTTGSVASQGVAASSTPLQAVLQGMLATGVSAAATQYALLATGVVSHSSISIATSPFQQSATAAMMGYTPFVSTRLGQGTGDVFLMKPPYHAPMDSPLAKAQAVAPLRSIVASVSSSVSLLFGSKIFLDRLLVGSDHAGSNSAHTMMPGSLLSSAGAGVLVGLVQLALHQRQLPSYSATTMLMQSPFVFQSMQLGVSNPSLASSGLGLVGRHTLAATLYFSVYESLTQGMSDDKGHVSSSTTLFAGLSAGSLHAAVMHYPPQNFAWSFWRALPAAMRAAPLHAAVFLGYETMKDGLKASVES